MTPRSDANCYTITIVASRHPTYSASGFRGDTKGFANSNISVEDAGVYRIFTLSSPQFPTSQPCGS